MIGLAAAIFCPFMGTFFVNGNLHFDGSKTRMFHQNEYHALFY